MRYLNLMMIENAKNVLVCGGNAKNYQNDWRRNCEKVYVTGRRAIRRTASWSESTYFYQNIDFLLLFIDSSFK